MKRIIGLLLAALLLLALPALAAPAVDFTTLNDEQLAQLIADAQRELSSRRFQQTVYLAKGGVPGLTIGLVELALEDDMVGKPAVTIRYDLYNTSSQPVTPLTAFAVTVTQNGQELENTYVVRTDGSGSSADAFTDLQPGGLVSMSSSFALLEEGPVTVTFAPLFDQGVQPFVFDGTPARE